jgi:hypothetical protein
MVPKEISAFTITLDKRRRRGQAVCLDDREVPLTSDSLLKKRLID